MAKITVVVSGNGFAYIDDPNPEPNQTVTLYATADSGETLDDITARDEWGYAIALATTPVQSFTYYSTYGQMTIWVDFSGSTPPPPPPFPWWLLIAMKKNNERGLLPYVRN